MGVERAKLLLAKAKDNSDGDDGVMKDSNIPLNYGASELEEDMETAKKLGILD
jgi:hypothetical protein